MLKSLLRSFLLLMGCLLSQQCLFAQNDQYKFSHLDITNGLSDDQVSSIYKDNKGFMWFGTTSGLNRYDGYKFRVFKHDAKDPSSLGENNVVNINEGPGNKLWIFTHSSISIYNPTTEKFSNNAAAELAGYHVPADRIKAIKKDRKGNFWFITYYKGLYCYFPKTGATVNYSGLVTSKVILHSSDVTDVVADHENKIWTIYSDGIIEKLDIDRNRILQFGNGLVAAIGNKPQRHNLAIDNRGNLWIYSNFGPVGAYCYNTTTNTVVNFSKDSPVNRLNSNIINTIVQGDDGKMWIGTDHGGINIVDPETYKVSYLMSEEDNPKSLSGNSVILYKDNTGIIWAGTFKQGVNYYHSGIMQFPLYRHLITDAKSLPFEDVDCFIEDDAGNLWIGTNGGGLICYNKTSKIYTRYKHDPSNPNSLSNDIVLRFCIDHEHKLWIGTYYGGLDCFDGKNFTHYRHSDKIPSSITDDRVFTVMEDSQKRLWAGTFSGGLNVFARTTGTFLHPKYSLSSPYTSTIYEDRQHNIWIGRDEGVDEIDGRTNKVRHYFNQPKNPNSLVANDVNVVMQDSRGLMWIGTKDGLSILEPKTGKFITADDGFTFPSSNISNILEDNQGRMWVSTSTSLADIKIERRGDKYKFEVDNFNEYDGLQGRGFNLNAAYKMRSGELIFGGAHGFNLFDPQLVNTPKPKENLVFTDLQLFNKSVAAGDTVNGHAILSRAISETKEITLNHSENVFAIEFAACNYFNPGKIKYQYTLEGFNKGWINAPVNDRRAIYTNLDGGDYTFKVRTLNRNTAGVNSMISLKIHVLPPFWKSPLAYVSYVLLAIGILLYMRHRGIMKLRREFELQQTEAEAGRKIAQEREEARRMHQLDLMKIKFFTNVSHEFRTPLSLILSPIDTLIKTTDKPDQHHHLLMIKRNGKRLLNLVNQLLDFRKMEYNELKLCLRRGDIIQFIKEVSSSFADVAQQKQIQYFVESEAGTFVTDFDHDKMERILFNLLSNAFKFTPSGGHISVILSLISTDGSEQKTLEIKVIDTGIGIPMENQEKIFERFFQEDMPENLLNQGSGIGLSITKEFVKMHGGTIEIESEPDYGSCFMIKLPVGTGSEELSPVVLPEEEPVFAVSKSNDDAHSTSKKPLILLIEDNDDLRFYLKDNLKHSFHIKEAVNGKDGWQKALALHPKLIVSDISMPEMNGLELCKKIKADSRTAQIPIILLTALTTEEDQLAGLDCGANDYIVKPFNFEILLSKIQNLLRMQEAFKTTFQKQIEVQAKDIEIVSEDEKFLKNALACIEDNITNPNFSVEELSRNLNLSRVSLYKKLLTLTGKTPVDCIRTIRLKRAVQLLEKSKLSIANVAYEVGFNNAAYFAKVFREEFGILPSDYISELRNKEKESPVTF